jgi:cobalt/nickel transport system permease protein
MTFAFTPLPRTASPLSRLDPRWKLAAFTLFGVVAATVHTPRGAAASLFVALILAALGRLPLGWSAMRLAPVLLFVAVFSVPLIFFPSNTALVCKIGPATVSVTGAKTASILLCKAAAIVLLALVVLATAPLDATLKAAHALHVPGLLVQLTLLGYRYLFVLAEEFGRMRIALRVRGYRNRMNLHSYRTIGVVTGALLVRGWERGERVGHAMRCRGFDGRFRSLAAFHTTAADLLMFFGVVAGAVGVCVLDWAR